MIPGVSQPEIQRQVRQQRADINTLGGWLSVSIRKSTPWTSRSTAHSMRSVASSPGFYVGSAVDSHIPGFHVLLRDPFTGPSLKSSTHEANPDFHLRLNPLGYFAWRNGTRAMRP